MTVQFKHDVDVSSFRCPVCGRGQPANLLVGGSPLAVRVACRLPEGFSVIMEGVPPIRSGDVLQLRSADGWYKVRVTNIVPREPDNDDWQGQSSGLFEVGLFELREYSDPALEDDGRLARRMRLVPLRVEGALLAAVVRWLFWTFSIVGIPLAAAALIWHSDAIVERYRTWRDGLRKAEAVATEADSLANRLRTAIRLPGATAFIVPEVAGELELTSDQQEAIRRIVAMTEDAFRVLDPQVQKAGRQAETEVGRKVLNAARQEVLRILTPEQRRRWDALVASAEAATP
ncbi:MAG: Spy/CpxP family protein refolding chaperone [Thermoguttaceae bacterium]|jgi:hypothetical protein|nr:Spy/CpxP family protein refolding chaperone [Thermoguttaceae bacterium]